MDSKEIDLKLRIKFRSISVELNINESLIVINTFAVKRAAIRGGLWSPGGKKTEKFLMSTLCMLFDVPTEYFDQTKLPESLREVDYYLIDGENKYRCEVKLMGRGNPESADAVIARDSKIFVADKLLDPNKKQLDLLKVEWVELRSNGGFKRFGEILKRLKIPHKDLSGSLDKRLEEILDKLLTSSLQEKVLLKTEADI